MALAGDISTDRPTVAASAHTVGQQVLQIETGLQQELGSNAGTTIPTLIRLGVSESFELRVDSSMLQLTKVELDFGGLGAGAKFTMAESQAVTLGLMAGATIPLAHQDANPYALLLADIAGGLWANVGWTGEGNLDYAVGYGLPLSGNMTPFVETAGGLDLNGQVWGGSVQGGAVWTRDHLEWDVYLQTNLDGFDHHTVAAGLAYRFGSHE